MSVQTTEYTPSKTVRKMLLSDKQIRIIMGPVGSGKSVGCLMAVAKEAQRQEPGPDGVRRSRFAVIRNTWDQLRDTTLKTWVQWFPDGPAGRWKISDKTFYMKFNDVEAEILFRPLDTSDDVRRLLSLELTGAYFNELREIDPTVFSAVRTRIGRYPSAKDVKCTHKCIIGDTNPPDEDSWLHDLMENPGPRDAELIEIFKQPSGLSEEAENKDNLPVGYYEDLLIGATQDFVDVYVHGIYGKSNLGKPVHQRFNERLHTCEPRAPEPGVVVVVGMDFGLTPAAVFKQLDGWGRITTLDELWTEDDYLEHFIEYQVLPLIHRKYNRCPILVVGDPSGKIRGQATGASCFDVLKAANLMAMPAPSNDPVMRIDATEHYFMRLAGDGEAAYKVSKECPHLIKALRGGYRFKKQRDGKFQPSPEKNIYSHIAEANQYGDMFYHNGMDGKYARKIQQLEQRGALADPYTPFDPDTGY